MQVYIDPAITGERRKAIAEAFGNWRGAGTATNSQVTYKVADSPPPAGSNSFIIYNAQPNEAVGAKTYPYYDQYGHTVGAETDLDPRVTNPDAVREVMAHEIGHPAGFAECDECEPEDSVMAPGPPVGEFNTVVGRPTSPSPCDIQRLQQTDYPYCSPPVNTSGCLAWDANTCVCNEYSSGGGGGAAESSGYYYCTPYYWVYYESWDGGETWDIVDVSYAGCW